ncbi:MAG: response regulator [Rhodocyclaceae bacterium]|nr:response regulator [Rhodocyclaceae bacterium]
MDNFRLRILVVDGDYVSRCQLSALVRQSGHEALEATDGIDGLAKAREFHPDIIVHHPAAGISGTSLVRELRAAEGDYRPYFLLVVAAADKHRLLTTLDLGIDDFIDKPLRPDMVAAQLRAGQQIVRLLQENENHRRKLQEYSDELISSHLRLRELTMLDDLTGLPNRRHAMELIQQEWAAAARDALPLSCMAIDLNGLKQINDEQGLERGDVVLKTVAAIMRKYLPPQDTVCRISGDEFLVIRPGAALNASLACGDKLVSLIGSFNIHAEGCPLGLSIGLAERRAGVDGPQELIRLAEQAMHHAKQAGRNLIFSAHAGEPRVVGGTAKGGRRKGRQQFALWRPAEGLGVASAGA